MAEREAIYKLKFLVDKGGQQESIRAIDTLAKEFADLDENAQSVSKSAQAVVARLNAFQEGRNQLQATADEAKQAAIDTDGLGDALSRAGDASADIKRVADEAENARKELQQTADAADNLGSRLEDANTNFRDVSNQVDLAGKIQRGTGSIRQLSQAAGLGGVSQGLGVGGDVAALAEDLPKLKAALQGMPDVIKAAYSEIGGAGVGLIGALVVLGLALHKLQEQAQNNRNDVKELVDRQREYNNFVSTATRQSIDERIADLKRQAEVEKETLATTRQAREQLNAALGENTADALGKIDQITGAFGTFDEINQQIDKSKDFIKGTEDEIQKLSGAYNSQSVIARTLAEDEKQLALERQANTAGYIDFLEERNQRLVAAEELLKNGTEEQIQARIDALDQEKEIARRNLSDIASIAGSSIADLLADVTLDPSIKASIERNQSAISDAQEEQDLYTTGTLKLADAQSALTSALSHQEDVVKNRIAQMKEQAKEEIDFNKFLKSANAESVQARVEALQEEQAALQANLPELERMAKTSTTAAKEFKDTTDRLSEIDAELQKIGSQGVIAAIQHEQEQLTAEIIKIEAARDEKIAQIRAQAAQKEADLYADLQRGLAEAVAKAAEDRADAQRDYIEKSADIEDDLAKKRLDIQKKFARSLEQAVDDRDALAAYQAKQTRDDDLSDAEDAAQEQRETLQKEYQKQLETIDRELTKQQQTLQAKYNQELSDLRTQTANSINLERQKAQGEINEKQQAYQQELALLQSFAQNGVSTISAFAQSSTSSLVQFSSEAQVILAGFVSQANSILSGLMSGGSNLPTPPPVPPPTPPPLPPPMHGPQPLPLFSGGGGGGLNIRIEGYTKTQIHAQLNEVLKLIMD